MVAPDSNRVGDGSDDDPGGGDGSERYEREGHRYAQTAPGGSDREDRGRGPGFRLDLGQELLGFGGLMVGETRLVDRVARTQELEGVIGGAHTPHPQVVAEGRPDGCLPLPCVRPGGFVAVGRPSAVLPFTARCRRGTLNYGLQALSGTV